MLFAARMLILGLHFVVATLIGLTVCLARPFNPDNSRFCARLYALPALKILGLRVIWEMSEMDNAPRPAVYVGNHLSNHDLFVFGSVVPLQTVSLGKASLKWIPLFGQLYWLAGNVLIQRGHATKARESMTQLTETLVQRDISIWIFPEGTRSHGKGLGSFKKGAFQLAINAGVPVVAVCSNTYVNSMDLNRWHAGDVILKALPAMPTSHLTAEDLPALIDECHQKMAQCIAELDARTGIRPTATKTQP